MAAAPEMAGLIGRPLCVHCRRCGRKSVFRPGSLQAGLTEREASERLVCSGCAARRPSAFRLCDAREAARWLADR